MSHATFISARVSELIVVAIILLASHSSAYPSKGHNGEPQRGVIPLGLFMSQLQVDMPDYHAEPVVPGRFTGGAKRKRHGHGAIHHTPLHSAETDSSGSCCPTVEEIVEPIGGKSKSGHLVELFQADDLRQQFHEISCAPNVAEQPCRFVKETILGQSQCVQQYSYSYALVRDFGSTDAMQNPTSGWRFEHIRVRSGCSCIISSS
ncbi:unnamed protein product [Orchesella dallaii]|uniref:Spaetzle domain-containing protein n=1 Tax=Orchesella dallaii TaxID=48710 RepID=A0ABP1RM69_9HEXA